MLAIGCGALCILTLLLTYARPGYFVVLPQVITAATCDASKCLSPVCTKTAWTGDASLQVSATVLIGASQEVDPKKVRVQLNEDRIHILYITRNKTRDPTLGDQPVPACLMPVTLTFDLHNLPRRDYSFSAFGEPAEANLVALAVAVALLIIALLFARSAWKRSRLA